MKGKKGKAEDGVYLIEFKYLPKSKNIEQKLSKLIEEATVIG